MKSVSLIVQNTVEFIATEPGVYVADKGFARDRLHRHWYEQYDAQVVSPPHQLVPGAPKDWRRWLGRGRLLRPSTTNCLIAFGWLASVPMRWAVFKHIWRQK